jgi:nucleoside-diphosphate-sugar epimerase
MNVLLTGASSFTGAWFAQALAERGHRVIAVFRRQPDEYDGLRASRVALVRACSESVHGLSFGDDRFLDLLRSEKIDVLGHHAAEAAAYRDPDFDVVGALRANTFRLRAVLQELRRSQGRAAIVLTGTFFEHGEGVGEEPRRAFNAYGLSKGLTASVVDHYAGVEGFPYGKFVIPNPFGPLEEPRFPAYLVKSWKASETPVVATPAYVRDNIHVSILAGAYVRFVEEMGAGPPRGRMNPSGYVETQGAFAQRFADEMSGRLGLSCPLDFSDQADFPEPRVRLNTTPARLIVPDWDEKAAWDAIADFYR